MATYLDEILAHHRLQEPMSAKERDSLAEAVFGCAPRRDFAGALRNGAIRQGIAVIAEIKRRSPSRGDLAPDLDPAHLAHQYARGGASCLSVLTDSSFFGGAPEDLKVARESCGLPVLRKDFVVTERDVYETRLIGADAMLLIVSALSDDELSNFHRLGIGIGLDVLVEVHDEAELGRALAIGALLIGVNQRDLNSFKVDPDRATRVGREIPEDVIRVAESGISSTEDIARLIDSGFSAVLIGEALVCADDPAGALRAFIQEARARRGILS
ncbi:MAG TPA: indole-3-glycerol phosphate synthase TrpC [Acidimicrobiales bacterium]|nr:indole-3-glycerol phosphate synthase TrpC [Acidimicrobiales bacterium]